MQKLEIERYDNALQHIYDASMSPDLWVQALAHFGSVTGSVGNHVLLCDEFFEPTFGVIHSGYGQNFASKAHRQYVGEFAAVDYERRKNFLKSAGSQTLRNEEMISHQELKSCPVHNEYNREFECERQLMFAGTISNRNYLSVCGSRSIDSKPYSEEELFLFNALSKHITRSFTLQNKVGAIFAPNSTLEQIISSQEHSVFILDKTKRLKWSNDIGRTLLSNLTSLSLINGRLVTRDSRFLARLDELVDQACGLSAVSKTRPAFTFYRDQKNDYHVSVFSVGLQASFVSDTKELAVLVFKPIDESSPPPKSLVSDYFGLTAAEAKLAIGLAAGKSINDYAELNNLSIHTVRSAAKTVLNKTECKRQVELILKLEKLKP